MRPLPLPRSLPAVLLPAATGLALVIACGEPFGLPVARVANEVDTVSLFALDGTPLSAPAGYDLQSRTRVRTDRSSVFDFAFNIDSSGAVLLPTGSLGLGEASGIQLATTPFDSILVAPGGGYVRTKPVVVIPEAVALVHSRPVQCEFGASVFLYAKLRVLAIDAAARRIDFAILVDTNCGYRGLEAGLPRR